MGYKAFYSGNALAVEISVKIFERRALTSQFFRKTGVKS